MLPVAPMVAELLLLLFARDASWLLPGDGSADVCGVPQHRLVQLQLPPCFLLVQPLTPCLYRPSGVEVAKGDDKTMVPFDFHFTAEDWQLLNQLRLQMSEQVGNYKRAAPRPRDRDTSAKDKDDDLDFAAVRLRLLIKLRLSPSTWTHLAELGRVWNSRMTASAPLLRRWTKTTMRTRRRRPRSHVRCWSGC